MISTTIVLYLAIAAAAASSIIRPNVGVVFEELPGSLLSGHDKQELIIAIPYKIPAPPAPHTPLHPQIQNLQSSYRHLPDDLHARLLHQATDIDTIITTTDHNIRQTIANIQHFLSDPIKEVTRSKRYILGFLGEMIFKNVFGMATTHDVDQVVSAIQGIDGVLRQLGDTDIDTADLISKLSARQDSILDTYIKDYSNIQKSLTNLSMSMHNYTQGLSSTLSSLDTKTNMLQQQASMISTATITAHARIAYSQGLNTIESSLRLLSTGILAPDMIQPTELADKL